MGILDIIRWDRDKKRESPPLQYEYETDPHCPFCHYRGPMPILWGSAEDDIIGVEPWHPVTPGHMIFFHHKSHTVDATDSIMTTVRVMAIAAKWAKDQGKPFHIITSGGAEATQTVMHLHIHYVPRASTDRLIPPLGSEINK